MNAAYAYDTQEASYTITNRIHYLLESKHWSVKTLSDESNIPYETLKKLLSRKTENTSFHNIMKIALAFNCNLNYFVEPLAFEKDSTRANITLKPKSESVPVEKNPCIPLFFPFKNPEEKQRKSTHADTLDISPYGPKIIDEVAFGIVISSYCYHPIYTVNDVLLVSRKRHLCSGEIGIFIHRGNIYVRTFYKFSDKIVLKSVNGIGPDIQIYDFSNWSILGYVAGVHKYNGET